MKSNLVTREGYEALKAELDQLWRIERPQVTQAVHEAAKNGDRSENGDYIYGKRRLREIDRRVRYLGKRLEVAQVVDYSAQQEGKVYFGALVNIESEEGVSGCYRIVGSDEIDPKKHLISVDSPMSRALLGKEVGAEVLVHSPAGEIYWSILGIRYPGAPQ
jgi:transcription elongation factor GreB